MDRLVCGDVGFGKTEVALRAAFVVAMSGEQVAVVVPTTLARAPAFPHLQPSASTAFRVKIRQLSRFVDAKEARETKDGARDRRRRYRHRHACAAREGHRVSKISAL